MGGKQREGQQLLSLRGETARETERGETGGIAFTQPVKQVHFCCAHYRQGLENFNQLEYIMPSHFIHNNVPKMCCIIFHTNGHRERKKDRGSEVGRQRERERRERFN